MTSGPWTTLTNFVGTSDNRFLGGLVQQRPHYDGSRLTACTGSRLLLLEHVGAQAGLGVWYAKLGGALVSCGK
jgi:hypothetical protein